MKKFKKYKLSTRGVIFTVIIFLLSGAFYYACSRYLNIETLNATNVDAAQIARIQTIKDSLLVILSICGTNLLLSALIEVHSKNSFLEDVINNDVIACPDFYNNMSEENKEKVYKALIKNLDSTIAEDIFSNIKQKLNNLMHDYYFDSCEYVVICTIHDDYIEKEITKKVSVKSYRESFVIKDFCVGNVSSKTISGKKTFELSSIKIDNKKIDINTKIKKTPSIISNLEEHNEYDTSESYVYSDELKIFNKRPTIITVKCITRTTKDDRSSSFRVTKPCKRFTLNYSLTQTEKYRLVVDAFGFLDDADDSTNSSSKSNINITFHDWIFKYDGVVVMILDK